MTIISIDKNTLQKKTIESVIWKFAERICAQTVSLIVTIILARILIPEDYSVVSIVSVFFAFSDVLISGGFSSALIQKKDADELDYSSVLLVTIGITCIIYILLFIFSDSISRIFHNELLVPIIRVMGLVLFVNSYKSVLCAWVSSRLEFKTFFASTIVGTITSAIVGIVLAYKGFGAWALVAQQMTNSIIDTLILSITTKYKMRFKLSIERVRRLFSFGSKIYIASIISVLYEQIKPLIVGIKFSTVDLAYYNKGERFPALINSTISSTMSSVLFPAISKVQDDIESVKAFTRRYMRLISFVVFPLMIGFCCIADSFVEVVLTKKWLPIVPYIRIFSFCYMFDVIQTGNLQAIRAIGRSDIILRLEIVKKVSYLIVLILFVLFSKNPVVLAASGFVTTMIASLINAYPNKNLIKYGYRLQIKDLLLNLCISIFMGLIILWEGNLKINSLLLMLFQIVSGIVVYFGVSYITKNENLFYSFALLKSFVGRLKQKTRAMY